MGKGTDKRSRGATRGFKELTYRQSDDGASSINLLAIECVCIYTTFLEGYQVLQVTMLLVVNYLLVKAVDVLTIDFDVNQFLNVF